MLTRLEDEDSIKKKHTHTHKHAQTRTNTPFISPWKKMIRSQEKYTKREGGNILKFIHPFQAKITLPFREDQRSSLESKKKEKNTFIVTSIVANIYCYLHQT